MKTHSTYVKIITCVLVLLTIVGAPIAKDFTHDFMGQIVDVYYQDIKEEIIKSQAEKNTKIEKVNQYELPKPELS